jgi:Tol biopolymer transport system component
MPDKSGLIVNAIDEVTRVPQIYSVSYPDGARRRITDDLNSYVGFSMTADAHSIVLPEIYSNREIWDLSDGDTANAVQVSSGREKHFDSVAWASDQYLVFDEDENSSFNNFNIYRSRPDGAAVEQLTFGAGNSMDPAVSPDGQAVVFVSSRSGTRQLCRMNIEGHDASFG